jgi:predicted nucleic acid-binding Zn ribbon protein
MKKSNTQPLKEVINEYINALKQNPKIKETILINSWKKVVGKIAGNATKNIYIKDRKLIVFIQSSIIRSELLLIKDVIISRLNKEAGTNMIDDIILK